MRNLLLSSVTLLLVPAVAIASPEFKTHAHTHTTPIELKPISSPSGIKVASVCFLGFGDCGDIGFGKGDENYQIDGGQQCLNTGYVNSCSSGYCLDSSCPYDSSYGKCQQETCPSGSSTSCSGDVVGQTACGNNCKKCCDDTCPSGYTKSTNAECYDTRTTECGTTCYKEKDCDPCPGYYECGGNWQYCEGYTCSADSSKCSTYCESDHFPHQCDSDYGPCYGDYRNGYCSVECEKLETEEDPCDGVSCGSNAYCSDGSCYCNSGYEGNANSGCTPTVTDPCEDVSCGSNAYCSNGRCYCDSGYEGDADTGCTEIDNCAGVTGLTCEFGCASTGSCGECTECKPDPCEGVTGLTCEFGCASTGSCNECTECKPDPCEGVTCEEGETCSNGNCVCNGIRDCAGICNGGHVSFGGGVSCCPAGYNSYATGLTPAHVCCPPGYVVYAGSTTCTLPR